MRLVVADFHLRPYFESFTYEDFLTAGANNATPFRFLAGTQEELTVFGGDAIWEGGEAVDVGVKLKHIDYDRREETSQFISALATWHGEELTQLGGEVGYMAADSSESRYLLLRAFAYWDQLPEVVPAAFVSGDVVATLYRDAILGEKTALFISLGAGRRFLDDRLEIEVSGDYGFDPIYDYDLRGIVTAKYVFGHTF